MILKFSKWQLASGHSLSEVDREWIILKTFLSHVMIQGQDFDSWLSWNL